MNIARLCALLVVAFLLGVYLGAIMGSVGFGVVAGAALSILFWLAAKHLEVRNAQRS
jgi:hypothetical protein